MHGLPDIHCGELMSMVLYYLFLVIYKYLTYTSSSCSEVNASELIENLDEIVYSLLVVVTGIISK